MHAFGTDVEPARHERAEGRTFRESGTEDSESLQVGLVERDELLPYGVALR